MTSTNAPHLAAALASACAAALLAACGGGGGGSAIEPAAPPAEGMLRSAAPGELGEQVKSRLARRQALALGVATPTGSTTDAPTAGLSGTQVQEAGVDEDDLLKSDGQALYALHPSYGAVTAPAHRLSAWRLQADGSLAATGELALDSAFMPTGMYLAGGGRRLAVLGQRQYAGDVQPAGILPWPLAQQVSLDVFDTQPGASPAPAHRLVLDGRLVATRMIGNVLYVASTWTPDLSIYQLPAGSTDKEVEARLAALTTADLLPTLRVDGGAAQPLVAESDCLVQPADASLAVQITTLTAIDVTQPQLPRRSTCFVGDASGLYMAPANVYLATSRDVWIAGIAATSILPVEVTTDIHKFALDGLQVTYRASGQVTGHLGWDVEKMPYRMSEHDGLLRVVSYTGSTGWWGERVGTTGLTRADPSPATLTVLREDAAQRQLVTVATLPNSRRPEPLGKPGEQVYAVQFAGTRGYVVTFRRTDPLYVLDLRDPADPRMTGELTVPGYSDYLFPLANGKLLGVGRDATEDGAMLGLRVSLFDVADAARPRLLGYRDLGVRGSQSALDHSRHGINLRTDGSIVRVALPVRLAYHRLLDGRLMLEQGLARFSVDTAAGRLIELPLVQSAEFDGTGSDPALYGQYHLGGERALQSALATYHLTGGQVRTIRE